MNERDKNLLKHIKESIERIEKYSNGLSKQEFMENELVQDAVIRQLEIIGEASKKLSDDFQSKKEEIEWRDIAGMRDKLIHGYFGVDLEIIWETINNELSKLKEEVQKKT